MSMNETYHLKPRLLSFRASLACPDAIHGNLIDVCFSRSSDVHVTSLHKASVKCLVVAKNPVFLGRTSIRKYGKA